MHLKESQNTEFKASWRDEYLKTLASFANSEGGSLFIGIDDNGSTVGINKAKRLLEDLPSKATNHLEVYPDVQLHEDSGKEFIEIQIKPAPYPVSYQDKFYIRSGSTTQELRGREIYQFLRSKDERSWDDYIEEKATFAELNPDTIERFKTLALERLPSIILESSHEQILEKLQLTENGKLKRAAILLFGKDPQRFYISSYLKIGKFLNEADIVSDDVITGNLFEQVEKAIEILKSKYLISTFFFEGIHRRERLEYPEPALREALLNAIIHRDYTGVFIQMRIYPDRISLWNEGRSIGGLTPEQLKTEHRSVPRNKRIAETFYKAGYVEAWGRGTISIIESFRAAGLPEPEFKDEFGGVSLIMYKEKYPLSHLQQLNLTERQIKIITYLKDNSSLKIRQQ